MGAEGTSLIFSTTRFPAGRSPRVESVVRRGPPLRGLLMRGHPPTTFAGNDYLLRPDLERIRLNLEDAAEAPQTDDDVMRLLAGLGVWRQSDEWWGADEATLRNFREGEIVERKEIPPSLGGIPNP